MTNFLNIMSDSIQSDTTNIAKEVVNAISSGQTNIIIEKLIDQGINLGKNILAAVAVYFIGRFIISLLKRMLTRMMERRKVEATIQSFFHSMLSILLNMLLIIAVIGALGINTASFAALLASGGLAIGMALSGNLQNFAGGIIILLFKPYKVGDWIEAQGVSGSVSEIQIMHTLLVTGDNKVVFIPNGAMSSGTIINYSKQDTRRLEWIVGVDYGEDVDKVKAIIKDIIDNEEKILKTPEPLIALHALDASSVNIILRAWVVSADYWEIYFKINKCIYDEFNKQGVNFPFPQLTVHQA